MIYFELWYQHPLDNEPILRTTYSLFNKLLVDIYRFTNSLQNFRWTFSIKNIFFHCRTFDCVWQFCHVGPINMNLIRSRVRIYTGFFQKKTSSVFKKISIHPQNGVKWGVSDCCLTSNLQLFSYIMSRTRYIQWKLYWWCLLCSRPKMPNLIFRLLAHWRNINPRVDKSIHYSDSTRTSLWCFSLELCVQLRSSI